MSNLYQPTSVLPNIIAPLYEADLKRRIPNKLWNAPFQFTIPLMGGMWYDLQRCWMKQVEVSHWKLQNNHNCVNDMLLILQSSQIRWGMLDPDLEATDTSGKKIALKCPVRAIAYFSWEESGRVFLARRVYPTFFNFLSYSHCPERWGALGRMMKELKEKKARYFNEGNFGITRIDTFAQSALPFLAEVKRLEYEAIFVVPVVKSWGKFNTTHDILGGFVFFIDSAANLPEVGVHCGIDLPFTKWLAQLNDAQTRLFDPPKLEKLWRDDGYLKKLRNKPEEGIFELRITEGACVKQRKDLRKVVSNLIASLSTNEFHAIMDGERSTARTAIVLIAKTDLIPPIEGVKSAILHAVGFACEQEPDKFIVRLSKL
jgi:hypothetical protein